MFFKAKKEQQKEDKLQKALDLGLITKGEFLKLKSDRADKLLKEYFAPKGKRKK